MSDKYKIRDTERKENKMTKELSSPIVPDEVVMNKIYVVRA